MAARNYSNIAAATELNSGINSSVTSLVVADDTGWPSHPFAILVDEGEVTEELILVGAKSGTTFSSLTRGYGGTSAAAHSGSAEVKLVATAEDLDLIWSHQHEGAGGDDTAAVSHDNLSGVSSDDHHAQAHAIDGADHTGTLDHDEIANQTANDHHNQAHAIDGADHTGTLDHSEIASQTADDHHDKSHAHDGADGSGSVDHGSLGGLTDDDHTQYLKEKASGGTAGEVPTHDHSAAGQAGTIGHGSLTGVGANDHHAQSHTYTSHTGSVPIADIPVGTGASQVAAGNHGHTSLGNIDTGVVTAESPSSNPIEAYRETGGVSDRLTEWFSNVGGTRAVKAYVQANGSFQSATGTYGTISDRKTKKNIKDARGYLSDLLRLKVRKFDSKITPGESHLGLIADEVAEVFPSLVETNEEGLDTVKTSVLIPMLLKAVQELSAEVETLKAG